MEKTKEIIWTRSLDDWESDKKLLGELANNILHLPCVRFTPVASTPARRDLRGPEGRRWPKARQANCAAGSPFIFTSPRSVIYASQNQTLLQLMQESPLCLAIGEATAQALKQLDIKAHTLEGVERAQDFLQQFEKEKTLVPEKTIILPGPKKRAYPLAEALEAIGYQCISIDLYENFPELQTPQGNKPSPQEIADLASTIKTVCFASPSAVKALTKAFEKHTEEIAKNFHIIAIGKTTTEEAKRWFIHVETCRTLSMQSMVDTVIYRFKGSPLA